MSSVGTASRYRDAMRARAWLSGLGFLSVLAAIAILAVLGARVLDDTDEVRTSPVDAARQLDDEAGTGEPSPSSDGDGVVLPGTGAGGVAQCEANRSTIETAAQAHLLTHGVPPVDLRALVDAGFLGEAVDTHTLSVADGEVVVTGVGACG